MRLSDTATFFSLVPQEVEAAYRLGALQDIVVYQRSLPLVRTPAVRAANEQDVLGVGSCIAHPIELSVELCGVRYPMGTFEAHAARVVLMVASMRLGLRVEREDAE